MYSGFASLDPLFPPLPVYLVTCSHHLTSFEVGASYSMPLMGQVSISYPRLPGGSIFSPETGITIIFCPDMDMNLVWKQTYFMQRADAMLLP